MRRASFVILAVLTMPLACCDLLADRDDPTLRETGALAGEPFVPQPEGTARIYAPGRYRVHSRLVGISGEDLGEIERWAIYDHYAGRAAGSLEFCLAAQDAARGVEGLAVSVMPQDCTVSSGGGDPGAVRLTLACPTPSGSATRDITQGAAGDGPDFRSLAAEPDGLGGAVRLEWHYRLENVGEC